MMIVKTIENIKTVRHDIDQIFDCWYDGILQLSDNIGTSECVPRKEYRGTGSVSLVKVQKSTTKV